MKRRTVLNTTLALAMSMLALSAAAQSREWPQSPLKLIVPFGPGSGADQVARLIGQELTNALGQAVIVDNKPGAGGNIGATAAARSAPISATITEG